MGVRLLLTIVAIGEMIASLAVKLSVTISPGFATEELLLLDAIRIDEKPGLVASYTTLLLLVVAVTVVPALPCRSLKLIEKLTGPSVSGRCMVRVACQSLPETLVTVTADPAMVAVGVTMVSLEVNLIVTISFCFARLVLALFDSMVTEESVGAVLSIV